jgi:hypothetical protein
VINKFRLVAALALVTSMFAVTFGASAEENEFQYHDIATDEFFAVWERTDYPVAQLEVARTWIWSPGAYSELLTEEYEEGEDGERLVQYFDKSRMEMPTLGAADTEDEDSPWFITQGLLATELMTGRLQIGDDTFEQHEPSQRSAAGDPGDTTAPTYAVMGELMEREPREGGEIIIEYADRDGNIVEDEERFAGYGVTDVDDAYEPVEGIDKNIASVFWDFMTSESIIYDADEDEFVEDDLFLNAFYAVGYPLTDAFWAYVTVDGVDQDVLIQCFERRCLTYTPGNPEGWEVESGNIGQHYYQWRYHEIDRDAPTDGTFTFDGETTAEVEVGDEITLTAHVMAHGRDVEDAPVFFWSFDDVDPDPLISLDPFNAETGVDGTGEVTVTGVAEGVATVYAFVDLDGTGVFNDDVDLDLGSVEVTVVAAEENDDGTNGNGENNDEENDDE